MLQSRMASARAAPEPHGWSSAAKCSSRTTCHAEKGLHRRPAAPRQKIPPIRCTAETLPFPAAATETIAAGAVPFAALPAASAAKTTKPPRYSPIKANNISCPVRVGFWIMDAFFHPLLSGLSCMLLQAYADNPKIRTVSLFLFTWKARRHALCSGGRHPLPYLPTCLHTERPALPVLCRPAS